MAVIGSLSVKLGLVTVEWDKATAQAKKQAKDLQVAFNDLGVNMSKLRNLFNQLGGAAGLSIAGFLAYSKVVMDFAGQIDDLSKTYDISIAKVLKFQNAIVQAGGKTEDAGKIMATMFAKIADAQQGNEQAIAAFEDLGITFEQLRTMSPAESINKVFQGLAQIGNTYDRIKATKEMLGRGGLHKSVEEIAEALGKSTAEFKAQEKALKEWADLGDRTDRTLLNLKLAFAEMFKIFAGGDFVPSVNQFKAAMVAITSMAVVNGVFKLVAAFRALNTALKSTAALGAAISATGGVKGIAMAGAGLAAYFGAMEAFKDADAESDAEPEAATDRGGAPAAPKEAGNRPAIAAGAAKLALARQMLDIDKRRYEYQMAYVTGSQDELALSESVLKYEEDIAKAEQAKAESLKADKLSAAQKGQIEETYNLAMKNALQDHEQRMGLINAKRDLALKQLGLELEAENKISGIKEAQTRLENERVHMTTAEYEKRREELALQEQLLQIEAKRKELQAQWAGHEYSPEFVAGMRRLNNEEESARQISAIRQRGIEEERMRQEDFWTGWKYAFEQYSQNAQYYGQLGQDAFASAASRMGDAIDNFVKTGKLNFKNFAASIIQDLIAIQLRMQAMQLFRMMLGIGNIGTAFAYGTNIGSTQTAMLAAQDVGLRAEGGPVNGGSPYIVGERGPELFVPDRGGSIIPNNQLASALGQSQPAVVYNGPYIANMSAIDTQSAVQFLTQNKQTIYAANQSAARSMPTNR